MILKENKKVTFDDFLHEYQCNGKTLIGVTTLMRKHGLGPEYGDINPVVLENAAARGTALHKAIQQYINGEDVLLRDTVRNGTIVYTSEEILKDFNAYKSLGIDAIASEFLISDNKTVASSIDIIAKTDNEEEVDLIDIKRTAEVHSIALSWQLGIYRYLLERQSKGVKVRDCYCAHIRNGSGRLIPVCPVDEDKVEALIDAERKGLIYQKEEVKITSIVSEKVLAKIVKGEAAIAKANAQIDKVKDSIAIAKESIYQYMLDHNIDTIECEQGRFTLKRPSVRTGINMDKLKKDYCEAYNACKKTSDVKGSIIFKSK